MDFTHGLLHNLQFGVVLSLFLWLILHFHLRTYWAAYTFVHVTMAVYSYDQGNYYF